MENKATDTIKSVIRVALVTGLILLLPYLAMQYNWQVPDPGSSESGGVNWTLADFIVMGTLLMGTGLIYELGVKQVSGTRRAVLAITLIIAFLLIWAELAVGLFGSPFAGS